MSVFSQIKYWVDYMMVLRDMFRMNYESPRQARQLLARLGGSTVDNTPDLPLNIGEVHKLTRLVLADADLEKLARA